MTCRTAAIGPLVCLALGGLAVSTWAIEGDQRVITSFTVLAGFPSGKAAASAGILLVPGTVIPVGEQTPPPSPAERSDVVEESLAFTRVIEKLWRTFRLDPSRQIQLGRYVVAAVSQGIELPAPPGADLRLSAELVGFSESTATYRVVFRQGGKALADSTVNVDRGGRALVGGMNGDAAPYVFVFVEPDPPRSRPVPLDEQAGIAEPTIVHKVPPVYPRSAKLDGAQGIVLVSAAIDTQGNPGEVRVLHSPDPRLSEAAVQAARQWRWEPARTRDGQPIAVRFTLTFNFRLD